MAQSSYILSDLLPDIVVKRFVQFIRRAGKHKILPNQKTQFIADLVKVIIRIITAAPDPYGVIMCFFAIRKKFCRPFFCHTGKEIVLRYVIGAHGKNQLSVYLMGKAVSPFILSGIHRHGTQTDFSLPGVQSDATFRQFSFYRI